MNLQKNWTKIINKNQLKQKKTKLIFKQLRVHVKISKLKIKKNKIIMGRSLKYLYNNNNKMKKCQLRFKHSQRQSNNNKLNKKMVKNWKKKIYNKTQFKKRRKYCLSKK